MDLLPKRSSARDLWPRLLVFGILSTVGFVVLIGRLYHLQISHGHDYFERSVNNFVKDVKVPADRGLLLDRRGEVLADSRPSYDLYLTPYFCGKRCEDVLVRLSAYLGLGPDEEAHASEKLAEARGLGRFKPFLIKVDIGRDLVDVFEAHKSELDGVDMLPAPHRNYRLGSLAAHLLGYLSEVGPDELARLSAEGKDYHEGDYVGRRGVERAFEPYLRGKDGAERVVVDAKGRLLPGRVSLIPEADRVRLPRPGDNVVLSLDARLQRVADETFLSKAGAVIALDPNTGFILAMVSKPEFDPNRLTGRVTRAELAAMAADPLKPELFRPIQEQYHPGSTFKVVTALAGLEHRAIDPESHTICNGGYTLGNRRWRCWKDTGHGTMDLHQAIVHSCDTFFYWVADRMGLDPLAQTARALGLGRPTGLGLGHEVSGVIPDQAYHNRHTPGGYQRGFALNAAIGQGDVNVTPLQLAVLYAAIANGGTVYRPQVVKRIEDPDGKALKLFEPEVRGRLPVRRENLKAVVAGLTGVVNEPGGTAYNQRLKDIVVAGKTGTAQVVAMGAVRVKSRDLDYWHGDHAWFCAFAPADKPEIAVVVVNEHAGHGGSVSAPTAMAVIKAFFENKRQDALAHPVPGGSPPPPPPPPHSGAPDPTVPVRGERRGALVPAARGRGDRWS